MSDIFHSSKSCINRAKYHLYDFNRQLNSFMNTNPCVSFIETDPNTAEEIHKIKLTKPLPTVLSNIAFDAAINLRCALDQCIFALSFGKGGRFAAFPFASDASHFEDAVKGRCKHLPVEIANLIRTFKAYKGGNDLLFALNELANTSKHAIICPVGLTNSNITYEGMSNISITFPFWDRTKNEMELFRMPKGNTTEININFSLTVEIGDIEFVEGKPAVAVLDQLIRVVEGIVMAIEAEAKRLGLC